MRLLPELRTLNLRLPGSDRCLREKTLFTLHMEPMPPSSHDPELKLDRFMPYLLNVLAHRVSRNLAQTYEARFEISIPEWRLLAHLAESDRISVREVFQRVDMDKAKISRAASSLVGRGLVEKRTSENDRRLVEMRLTEAGTELFRQIKPLALEYERQLLSRLSEPEQQALAQIVSKLLEAPETEMD